MAYDETAGYVVEKCDRCHFRKKLGQASPGKLQRQILAILLPLWLDGKPQPSLRELGRLTGHQTNREIHTLGKSLKRLRRKGWVERLSGGRYRITGPGGHELCGRVLRSGGLALMGGIRGSLEKFLWEEQIMGKTDKVILDPQVFQFAIEGSDYSRRLLIDLATLGKRVKKVLDDRTNRKRKRRWALVLPSLARKLSQ